MPVETASFLNDLNASNPPGTDQLKQADDHFRLMKTVLKATFPGLTRAFYLEKPVADLASSASPALGATTSNNINITGTTTITSFAGGSAGMQKLLRFAGALTLTHHASNLPLQGAANIVTEAGDFALAICEASGQWMIPLYIRASGLPVTNVFPTIGAGDVSKFLQASNNSPQARIWAHPVPAGAIIGWPADVMASGWILCDGRSLLRTEYPDLFAVIGVTYGAADGTHFYIPDYRGLFLRGADEGADADPDRNSRLDRGDGTTGDVVGTRQADELKAHTHAYDQPFFTGSPTGSGASRVEGLNAGAPTGSTGGNETRPRNVSVHWLIKAH